MHAFMTAQAGAGAASVFGSGMAPPRMAALVNGTTSRALDFDHTHLPMLAIYLLGAEVVIRVGLVLGNGHYNRGFHQTNSGGIWGSHCCRALNEPNP
jgi:hypothetical protein